MSSPYSSTNFGYDRNTGNVTQEDPGNDIRPEPSHAGRVRDGLSYGGYASTVVQNPDGTFSNDPSHSGVNDAVNRFQGLGAAAAQRQAATADYHQANLDALQGQQARGSQQDALNGLRSAAMGNAPTATTGIGQGMVDAQLQGQIGASAGSKAFATRGAASLSAASAAAQAGAQQQGVANAGHLAGMRAGEMMDARGAYGHGATGMRAGDYAQQATYNKRAITQGGAELQQAGLNQAQQMGFEGLAQGAREAQNNANMKQDETDAGIYANSLSIQNQEKNRGLQYLGAGATAGGSGLAALAAYRNGGGGGGGPAPSGGGGGGGGIYRGDPYSDGGDGYSNGIYQNDPYGSG